jgi:hypothetical protein
MKTQLQVALGFLSGLSFLYAGASACTLAAWFTFGRTSFGLLGLILAMLAAFASYFHLSLSRKCLALCLESLKKDITHAEIAQAAVSLLQREGLADEAERLLKRHNKATSKSLQVD